LEKALERCAIKDLKEINQSRWKIGADMNGKLQIARNPRFLYELER